MVKKVYPDDVEAVLVRDQRIRDAAVVGLDRDGSGVKVAPSSSQMTARPPPPS